MAVVKVTAASQAHFSSSDSAALIFAQESKALHTDLEERSKAEAASEKSYTQKMQRLEVDTVCAVPFSLENFQTFNHLFDRLVHWKTSSSRQKRHPCKDSLHRNKQFLQQNCCRI